MRQLLTNLIFATIVCQSMFPSIADAVDVIYMAKEEWNITGTSPYSLHSQAKVWTPKSSIGLTCDSSGNVYICDEISQALVSLNKSGYGEFAVGSKGPGPEEHRGYGEVLFWNEQYLARADCTTMPKLILFDDRGQFQKSMKIEGIQALSRLFWNGKRGVAVGVEYSSSSTGGSDMSSFVYLVDPQGNALNKVQLKTMTLKRGKKADENEIWIEPKIAVSRSGYTYIQSDLFSDEIVCFDDSLHQVWTINGKWKPRKRSSERFDYIYSFAGERVIVDDVEHTIERLVARDSGNLWVRTFERSEALENKWLFEVFEKNGSRSGTVRIDGLPDTPGIVKIVEDTVIWLEEYSDEKDTEEPYLRVFRLVESK